MKRKLMMMILSAALLVGCGTDKEGTLEAATVVGKELTVPETTCDNCIPLYYIVVEKDGVQTQLRVADYMTFEAIEEGTIMTVTYDDAYRIESMDSL